MIRPGDLLHVDFGITYLRLNTDTQQHAYVLRPGEVAAPAGLVRALAAGNRLQDILTENFAAGRSGNDILAGALAQAEAEGIDATIYTHPIGFHGHGAGPTIGPLGPAGRRTGARRLSALPQHGALDRTERGGPGPGMGRTDGEDHVGRGRILRRRAHLVYRRPSDRAVADPAMTSARTVVRSLLAGSIGALAILAAGAGYGLSAQMPHAWVLVGQDADDYRLRLDAEVAHSGASSMRLAARGNRRRSQWAASVQMVDATAYRGKRMRLGGYLRGDDLGSGGLWVRVDGILEGRYAMLALDNSEGRRIEETQEWEARDIVIDIPPEGVTILLGAMITGDGTLWVDDLAFDAVSGDVPLTTEPEVVITDQPYERPLGVFPTPTNLDFEREMEDPMELDR